MTVMWSFLTMQLAGSNRANFGLTNSNYIIGYLTNATLNTTKKTYMQLTSGAGWLVRECVGVCLRVCPLISQL